MNMPQSYNYYFNTQTLFYLSIINYINMWLYCTYIRKYYYICQKYYV